MTLALTATVGWSFLDAQRYDVARLEHVSPSRTALMEQRAATAAHHGESARVDQRWVPYERISPTLRRAVLVAEDDGFFAHGGLDWNEISASLRKNLEQHRVVRGGSTITQQLARNLFLGDQRTLTRKLTELFIALRLEQALSKRRIFELYLNEIEWGDGIYGIEAAARHNFGVSAVALNPRQSVLLAAVIINPHRFSVLKPPARIQRRVRIIAGRLRRRGALDATDYARAIGVPPRDTLIPTMPSGPEVPPEVPSEVPSADSSLDSP